MSNLDMSYPMLLTEGVAAIRAGEIKPSEWTASCIDVIEKLEDGLKAWGFFDAELARQSAEKLDLVDWSRMKPFPALAGAPLGVKDIFNTYAMPNSMGSPIRREYFPGNDARVIEWAKLLGATVVGKTKTAEFAVHHPPDTLNPWGRHVIAGTSSTGSAVAVAAGMIPAAFSTQSGGSIARPASYNGVVGYKPSFGLIPRTGVLKTCDTLDTIGWMTRSVADSKLLLDNLRVRGDNYPMVQRGMERAAIKSQQNVTTRVALVKAPGWKEAQTYTKDEVKRIADQLSDRKDVKFVELDLQEPLADVHDIHATIYNKSLSYYFFRELSKIDGVSHVFKEINEIGSLITPQKYFDALAEQERVIREFDQMMGQYDILITPSVSGEAVKWEEYEKKDSSLIWTTTGAPIISLPLSKGPKGLPIGMTLIGQKYADYALLEFAESVMPEAVYPVFPSWCHAGDFTTIV